MDSKYSVEIKNIVKKYKTSHKNDYVALDNVSFNIEKGDVIGIIGRNGSGKSTLLSIIAGIMKPSSGQIVINGKVASVLELGMGFHPDLTGRENIFIKGSLYGFTHKEIDSRLQNIIKYSELGDFIDYPVRQYSSGMVGRLAFAIMVNVDADILLIDEMLSTGDAAFSFKASAHFRNLANSGKTVIITSHSNYLIKELCNKVAWIDHGILREFGSANIVCNHYDYEINNSYDILVARANSGDAIAQTILGKKYLDGIELEKNNKKAYELFKNASELGNNDAHVYLADMYYLGNYVKEDKSKAFELYLLAANKGHSIARMKIASYYQTTESVECLTRLIEYVKKMASESDCGRWDFIYAQILEKKQISSPTEIFKIYLNSAQKGYAPSQFSVGMMFRYGNGTKKSIDDALLWLKRSANNNYVYACKELGSIYNQGVDVAIDFKESLMWYRRASELGDLESQYQIAMALEFGKGVERNHDDAINAFHTIYVQDLSEYYFEISQIILMDDPKLSFSFCKEASKSNNAWYVNKLAEYYRDGVGVESNIKEAAKLFFKAANNGIFNAADSLLKMLTNSIIVDDALLKKCLMTMENMAKTGNVQACNALASYYSNSLLDNYSAYQWYSKGSVFGNAWSIMKKAEFLEHGEGIKQNSDEAYSYYALASSGGIMSASIKLFFYYLHKSDECGVKKIVSDMSRSALSGNDEAALFLANIYETGLLGTADVELAQYWYKISIKNGNGWGMYKLAELLNRIGGGTLNSIELYERSAKKGIFASMDALVTQFTNEKISIERFTSVVELLKQNARCGNIDAANKLAMMYYNGVGVVRNHTESAYWFSVASFMGNPWSKTKLAEMYIKGYGVDADIEKAISLLEAGAESGISEAINLLAELGVPTEKQLDLLKKSANLGFIESMVKIAMILEPIDSYESRLWYLKAASNGNLWAMSKYNKLL